MVTKSLRDRASTEPDRIAVRMVDGRETSATYGELDRQARRVAAAVVARTPPESRVLLTLPPGIGYVAAFFGILYAGRIAVPAYPPRGARGLPRLARIAAHARAAGAIGVGLPGCPEIPIEDGDVSPTVPTGVAMLQYTSGSTAEPKGVAVTHDNLAANLRNIGRSFRTSRESVGVIWLPPYHDMGLIGGILHPIDAGFPVVLTPPTTFLRHPMRWLELVSRYGATISGAPGFAYDLCVERSDEGARATLDLSRWTTAFCGAEPIRARTLERFAAAFAASGFRRRALVPCYGLAESTLVVSARVPEADELPRTEHGVVDCGRPLEEVAIVDGEIWLRGPSVASGYFDDDSHAFQAEHDGKTWLRTGDLGFLEGGSLFVTGRSKELLVVRGRKVHPHDVERVACDASPALAAHAAAAFESEEGIVLVVETHPPLAPEASGRLQQDVRAHVTRELDVGLAAVVLARRGEIPRTSSGKVRRADCRALFESGAFGKSTPRPARSSGDRESLRHAVSSILRLSALDDETPLSPDSLATIEIQTLVFGRISLEALADGATFADLARAAEGALPAPAERPIATAARPATWAERMLHAHWREAPASTAFHVCAVVPRPLPIASATFHVEDGVLVRRPASGLVDERLGGDVHALAFAPFDLERGPLVRQTRIAEGQWVLSAHHAVADLHVLGRAAAGTAESDPLPVREDSLAYFRERLAGDLPVLELPMRARRQRRVARNADTVRFVVPAPSYAALRTAAKGADASLFVALLAAYQRVLARHAGTRELVVGVETVGGVDVNPVPLRFTVEPHEPFGAHVRRLRGDVLAALEHRAFPFPELVGALGLSLDPAVPPVFQTVLNFASGPLARFVVGPDALFAPHTPTELMLLGGEIDGELHLALRYDRELFEPETIRALADELGPGLLEMLAGTAPSPRARVVLAAGFTTQPIEPSLRAWLRDMGAPIDVVHAPYGQVFQELLDPASELRRAEVAVVLAHGLDRGELARAVSASTIRPLVIDRLDEIARRYEVDQPDPEPEIGGVIFGEQMHAAIGTTIARAIRAGREPRRKVIAVDCDDTLWAGVCGEDGPHGVRVETRHASFHRFLEAQREAGALLVTCSKNDPRDVMAVFEAQPAIRLRPEHFVRHGIGWGAKADTLRGIAKDLGLGLDAFVLFDDNPVERGAVRATLPDVLVASPDDFEHVWDLDRPRVTAEDQRRATLQAESDLRAAALADAGSLETFLATLDLVVAISPMTAADVPRVAQLTQRTNQFTTTTARLDEAAVQRLADVRVVRVRDRFGDYGLVGVMAVDAQRNRVEVPIFLLSCRALGRRVEDHMLSRIVEIAAGRPIAFALSDSGRNEPALTFLRSLEAPEYASHGEAGVIVTDGRRTARPLRARPKSMQVPVRLPSRALDLQDRILALRTAREIVASLGASRTRRGATGRVPEGITETRLAGIWRDVLRVDDVRAADDFFALGGTSLDATFVLARVRRELAIELPVGALFSFPTLAALAKTIEAHATPGRGEDPSERARQRLAYLQALDPSDVSYNVPAALRLRGALDIRRLTEALEALVRRHPSLRTSFDAEGRAIVHDDVGLTCERETPADIEEWLASRTGTPFDVSRAPLVRVALAASPASHEATEHVLSIVAHHLVVDGASLAILMDELASLYVGASLAPVVEPATSFPSVDDDVRALAQPLVGAPSIRLDRTHARTTISLSPALVARVHERARAQGMTPFMLYLAAFFGLLARATDETDTVAATPVTGRQPDDRRVGFFVNTLPIRVDCGRGEPVATVLARVREASQRALAHSSAPFDAVLRASGSPRVAALFAMQPPLVQRTLDGLSVDEIEVSRAGAQFDLLAAVRPTADGGARVSFEGGDASLAGVFVRLLEVLATAELDAPFGFDLRGTVADRIEAQVDRTPDRIAVSFEGESLTYAELDARANEIAARVAGHALVGIHLPRSIELVVAVLGVLKSGAAYVPLEPELPARRKAAMSAHASFVITHVDGASRERTAFAPGPLAYVMFTSGSTGEPKGVEIGHPGLLNRIAWMQEELPLGEHDVVVQKTPFGFDVSVWELLWPLMVGARLVVARPGGHRDARYLAELFVRERVTVAHFVPSMLDAMLESLSEGAPSPAFRGLSRLVSSGEALGPGLVRRLRAEAPLLRVHNLYGPTEATIDVTHFPCPTEETTEIPIGFPIANTYVRIADDGELLVGGVQLARGYLGRPDETALRFVDDPDRPGRKLYRTGDRVRRRDDGALLFLGRLDHQVKVRGVRVEPDEVARVLETHPEVREAVVVVQSERLVAYVVPPVSGLAAFALERLPEAMRPSAFVGLTSMPVGPNGKVDRAALPAPERAAPSALPDSERERTLAAIWAEALAIETVGRDDDFFALGGDSILALKVVARAARAGFRITLRDLVRGPTVRALAACLPKAEEHRPRLGPAPLTPMQERFFSWDLATPDWWNQSVLVELDAPFEATRVRRALDALVATHDALRARFDGGSQTIVSEGSAPLDEVCDLEAATLSVQRSLSIAKGPVLRVAGAGRRLLFVAHHLVVDAVSWRILLEDFLVAYRGGVLPPPSAPLTALPAPPPRPLREGGRPLDVSGPATRVVLRLSADETAELQLASVEDVLLGALGVALDRPGILVDREGHGRDHDLDLSRTVGWLTEVVPLRLDIDRESSDPVADARRARLAPPGLYEARPDVLFDYLGAIDDDPALRVIRTASPHDRDPSAPRTHALELVAYLEADDDAVSTADAPRRRRLVLDWRTPLPELPAAHLAAVRALLASGLPLTPTQEAMRVAHELAPGTYIEQTICQLREPLDEARLAAAVATVTRRHEALRSFVTGGRLHVAAAVETRVECRSGELAAFLESDRRRGFDLAEAPLFRVTHIGSHVVFTHHHLALDGWSLPLVLRACFDAYRDETSVQGDRPRDALREHVASREEPPARAAHEHHPTRTLPFGKVGAPGPKRERRRILEGAFVASLSAFARRERVTLGTLFAAAYALVLGRAAGTRSPSFGMTVAGRSADLPRAAERVGAFIRTLPFSLEITSNVGAWLRAVAVEVAELPTRAEDAASDVETLFVFESYPFAGLPAEITDVRVVRDIPIPLVVSVTPREPFTIEAAFDPRRLDDGGADRLLETLEAALQAMMAAADADAWTLPLTERRVDQSPPTTDRRPLHTRIVESERDAVVHGSERISYGTLLARARGLAGHLPPRSIVGLLARPSIDFVVGALAALFAGAAYLPLDPDDPPARQATLVREANLEVVMASGSSDLDMGRARVVDLRGPGRESALPETRIDDLAYVLFTSGSSGHPKAVMCRHVGVANLLDDLDARAPAGRNASWWTKPTFDVSVFEIFAALTTGATLHVVPAAVRGDASALLDWLEAHRIDSGYLPGFVLPLAAERGLRLGRLLVGVEPIDASVATAVLARSPGLVMVNGYGPTEASVCATLHTVRPGDVGRIPIGHAVKGAAIELLDAAGQPVPQGMAGEIVIRGEGVAEGYLSGPRFEGAYVTGDRAYAREDGALVWLGRLDAQVKRHGVRIELAEIERAVLDHPAVTACAVTPDLTAFVEPALREREVMNHLRALLPAAMMPARVVGLERMPRGPNGKIDRQALAVPARPSEAPRTPAEEIVAGLFRSILGVDDISRDADFFALGGHSLAATRLASSLRAALGAEVSIRAVFEERTVAAIAKLARGGDLAPLPRADTLVASFGQERLWLADRLDPDRSAYNLPCAVRIRGAVDRDALARSIAAVVERHEPLRTVFGDDGAPRVLPAPPPALDVEHVDGFDGAVRDATTETRRPFDLARDILLRPRLFSIAADDHVLTLTMHHAAADGASLGILVREIDALYAAFVRGETPALPPLPIRYRDYAAWERARDDEPLRAYWVERLRGLPPALDLPYDREGPRTSRGGHVRFRSHAAARVEALGQKIGATPFMVLLAAIDAVLARATATTDIAVGASLANRTRRETESLVGFFVNLVVVRVDLEESSSFLDLVAAVRASALEAYDHQAYPFDRLAAELRAPRALGQTPLFQVNFVYQGETLTLPFEPVTLESGAARFDLALSIERDADGYAATLEYRTDLFDRATAERIAGWFDTLLAAALEDPKRPWRTLPLGRAAAREPAEMLFASALAHELVEAAADREPERIALRHGASCVTYAELDARANGLAHRLRARGVGRESRVGICLPRSIDQIVSVLAVAKAGGAYVPLDPTYPPDRLAWLVDDAAPLVVIATDDAAESLPAACAIISPHGAPAPRLPRLPGASPDDLAYLIYTSGSTGTPAGVAVLHRGVVNLARAQAKAFGITSSDRVLQFAPLAFDASVSEIFVTLAAGAMLDLGADRELADALDRVTIVTLPPSVLAALDPDRHRSLRVVVVAGEACPRDLAARWSKGRVLLDAYGPTEATVCATVGALRDGRPSIGTAIDGVNVTVEDETGEPVPPGIAGEIVIRGVGVARGYWGRPERRGFVDGAFRTGDIGRFRASGELDFLGRRDDQFKLRGFRIEPGEVEACLRTHPSVEHAVVTIREGALVAYVVGEVDDLAGYVAARLPAHLVPSAFVPIASIPRTPNGKIDRRALPAIAAKPTRNVSASTPVEETLVRLFSELLRRPVGVTDNFFEVGGDSIASVQLVARARREGLAFTVKALFEHQTIALLAPTVTPVATGDGRDDVGPEPFPLSPVQRWFFAQDLAEPNHYNQSVLLALGEPLDAAHARTAFAHAAERHDALRLRFEGGMQSYAGAWPELETADGDIEAVAASAQRSLDIANGPVARVLLFERQKRLLLVFHHLVVDAVSFRWILEDFFAALEGRPFEPKTASFKAWCVARAEDDDPAERAFWVAQRRAPVATLDAPNEAPERRARFEVDAKDILATSRPPLGVDPQELLLAAIATVFPGPDPLLVDIEGHGRDSADIDVSRTVGWFTAVYPVRLDTRPRAPTEVLSDVKTAVRAVPRGGIGADFASGASIGLNYLGRLDQAFERHGVTRAPEACGPEQGPGTRRPHPLELQAFVEGGRFVVTLLGSGPVDRWAASLERALVELAALGRTRDLYRASDFPGLTSDELTDVLAEVLE